MRTVVLLLWLTASGWAQQLIPAGSINGVFGHDQVVLIVEDDPAIGKFATGIRERFFEQATIVGSQAALETDLRGKNLVVYGTAEHPWLAHYRDRLPFRFGDGVAFVQDRRFEGRHLRVICAITNPQDPARRAVLYTAADAADVVNINAVFHGPTEWVVADGRRPLASGNYRIDRPLSAAELREDLDALVDKIAAVHPATVEGLPERVTAAIAAARERFATELPREQAWLELNHVLLALRDAHSSLAPFDSGESLNLPVVWLREGLVVTADTDQLRRGDLVLKLGALGEAELLEGLRGLIPAENDHWVKCQGERVLADAGVLRLLGAAEGLPVAVEVDRAGETVELRLGPGRRRQAPRQPWARFEIDEDHALGVFTLDQCRIDDFYKKTVRDFFAAVADDGVERVAVDLRENSGGNSQVVNEFLRYIDLGSYADFTGNVRWSEDVKRQRGYQGELGYVKHDPRRTTNRRVDEPFQGELYLLTSKRTFSSGNWFAAVVQDNGIGEVLGEPTGNSPSSYGDILSFALPHSGFAYTLSFKQWVRPDADRDPQDSIVPDRVIPLTRQHVIDGVDPVLEFLRN